MPVDLPAALRDDMLAGQAQILTVPPAQLLFDEGEPCRGLPMLLAGEVRVARGTPNGRLLALYRVGPGELCVASTLYRLPVWPRGVDSPGYHHANHRAGGAVTHRV